MSGNKFEENIFVQNFLSNKMVVNFDMLGTSIMNGVGGESEGTNIVTLDPRWDGKRDVEVLEEHTEPVDFGGNSG
jgi:hypothetical protein